MDVKTKTIMRNMVVDALSNGQDYGSAKEKFLTMRMVRDFGEECYFGSPSLLDIYDNLIACDIIDNKDISTRVHWSGKDCSEAECQAVSRGLSPCGKDDTRFVYHG